MEFVSTLSRWSKNLFSTFLVFSFHKKKKKKKISQTSPPVTRQLISSSTQKINESKITYPRIFHFLTKYNTFYQPTLPSPLPFHRESSMTVVTRVSFLTFRLVNEQKEGGRAPWWIIRLDIDSRPGQSISCRLIRGKATKERERAIGSSNRFVRVGGGREGGRSNVICAIRVVEGWMSGTDRERERQRERRTVNSEILARGGGQMCLFCLKGATRGNKSNGVEVTIISNFPARHRSINRYRSPPPFFRVLWIELFLPKYDAWTIKRSVGWRERNR